MIAGSPPMSSVSWALALTLSPIASKVTGTWPEGALGLGFTETVMSLLSPALISRLVMSCVPYCSL